MSILSQILKLPVRLGEKWPLRRDGLKAIAAFTPFSRLLPFDPAARAKGDAELIALGLLLLRLSRGVRFNLARDIAMLAEGLGNEAAFRRAMRRAFDDAARAEAELAAKPQTAPGLVNFHISLLDFTAARRIAAKAQALSIPDAEDHAAQIDALEDECRDWRPVIDEAGKAFRARVMDGADAAPEDRLTLYVPIPAFRSNPRDYPGFRQDIRRVFRQISGLLDEKGMPYRAVARLAKHGEIKSGSPYIAYHSIGSGPHGLHIKETDRRSHFSADRSGYSGWSAFSQRPLPEPGSVDRAAVRAFIARERQALIAGNESKYEQPEAEAPPAGGIPYVFVPLQIIDDAVQRLAFMHMFDMLEDITATCRARGIAVVVKRHPLCKSKAVEMVLGRGVRRGLLSVSAASIHPLIAGSSAVCVINSGTGAEALLHGKPVYTFGAAEYQAATFPVRKRGDFAALFEPDRLPAPPETIEAFLYTLRNVYAVDVRDEAKARTFWESFIR